MLPFITQPAVAPAYRMAGALLFRGAQYLSRTPGAAGDQTKWTFSCWVRRAAIGTLQHIFRATDGVNNCNVGFDSTDRLFFNAGAPIYRQSAAAFRDPAAWGALVVVCDTQNENEALRFRMFWNGAELSWSSTAAIGKGATFAFNASVLHYIGGGTNPYSGYLAEPCFVGGQALSPSDFGEADPVTGSWRPKKLAGTAFGINGFLLGNPWNTADLGKDYSGQGNNWTPFGLATTDVVADNPSNVHAMVNPLSKGALVTLTDGALTYTSIVSAEMGARMQAYATQPFPSTGVWQMEMTIKSSASDARGGCGVALQAGPNVSAVTSAFYLPDYGQIRVNGSIVAAVPTATSNDVIGVVADVNAGTVSWYKNGTLLHTASLSLAGLHFFLCPPSSTTASSVGVNFGQRAFGYTPVANARSLCTVNLALTTGQASGTFTGNLNADGPCIFTGAVPQTLTINGNAVTWGTHADKLATGFKLRTASASYNGSGNTWTATYDRKPTVGRNLVPANAQINP